MKEVKGEREEPEERRVGGPMGQVFGERIAMESEIIPPVVKFLLPDVETCGQPDGLGRVVGVKFELLLQRQPKEGIPNSYRSLHQFLTHSMVPHLRFNFKF